MSGTTSPAARRQLPIPAAKKAEQSAEKHANTAAALGRDLAQRVLNLHDDDPNESEQIARIFIHTLVSLPGEHLGDLVREPANTGLPRWDALLQALVAWRCQTAVPPVDTPAWANSMHLDEAWAPFGDSIRDDGWYVLSVLSTPAAFLHRGVVLDRRNLQEL
jgi:hypothetical protein